MQAEACLLGDSKSSQLDNGENHYNNASAFINIARDVNIGSKGQAISCPASLARVYGMIKFILLLSRYLDVPACLAS